MITAICILFALAAIILILLRKGIRDAYIEPTSGTIRYDMDYPDYTRFDAENLQEFPTEFEELTNEAKAEAYNDLFKNGKLNDSPESYDVSEVKDKMKDINCNFMNE
jgi:hypothetical protein